MSKCSFGALLLIVCVIAGWLLPRQALSVAKEDEVGKFQTHVEGSRVRSYGFVLRLDTTTGKTWRGSFRGFEPETFRAIEEPAGPDRPEGRIGRYQMDVSYMGDSLGQESPAAVRFDTVTGKCWYLQMAQGEWRWVLLKD